MRDVFHSPPILRISKLKWSRSSSELESPEALVFLRVFVVKTYFTALATRAFRSLPSTGCFLAPWNLTRPALLPILVNQVDFIALACGIITLHAFISWTDPWRGHTGEFLFLGLFLLAPSSKGFAAWFEPFLCAKLADWGHSPDWLVFFFVISLTLRMEYFLEMFETLIELDELLEALSCGVKPLDDEFLL